MKGVLVFKLPEESDDFETSCSAGKLKCALDDIREFLRRKRKYEDVDTISIEAMEKEFYEIIHTYGIDL